MTEPEWTPEDERILRTWADLAVPFGVSANAAKRYAVEVIRLRRERDEASALIHQPAFRTAAIIRDLRREIELLKRHTP